MTAEAKLVLTRNRLWPEESGSPGTRRRVMTVTTDGDILVADAALRQVLRLASDGQLLTTHTGGGQLQQPVAITATDEGSFWVLDSVDGEWLKISRNDEVLATLLTDRTSPASPPRDRSSGIARRNPPCGT